MKPLLHLLWMIPFALLGIAFRALPKRRGEIPEDWFV